MPENSGALLGMTAIDQGSCRNILLRTLSPADFALLAPGLSRVTFDADDVVAVPGGLIEAIYFPEIGIITFSELIENGSRIGIGHTGFEGFSGWSLLLGCALAPHEARMTAVGGTAVRISCADLLAACRSSDSLRDLLLRFVRAFTVQLSSTIVSSLTQPIDTRLCRWTLMAHDRVEGDEIVVTHNEIAVMLGIRRSSVTDALHILEGERLIQASRGRVTIRDRDGLQRRAGSTYGFAEVEYSRLIAPFPGPQPIASQAS
jgi:CRP-like cAMP-binding protein